MPELHKAGVAYLVAIANFYYQSHGFSKFYNQLYAYWKCVPLFILITFVTVHGGGVPPKKRVLLTAALLAGVMGDYVIGLNHEGIIPGAIAFGVGHVCYLMLFAHETRQLLFSLASALAVWSAFIGVVCMLPLLKVSVVAVGILAVYSLALNATLIYAASQFVHGSTSHEPGTPPVMWRCLGFALFYFSDTVLILNHTGFRIPCAEHVILFSYFASQYLLVRAEVSYEKYLRLQKESKRA